MTRAILELLNNKAPQVITWLSLICSKEMSLDGLPKTLVTAAAISFKFNDLVQPFINEPSTQEVTEVILKLLNTKAPQGVDNLPAVHLKYDGKLRCIL